MSFPVSIYHRLSPVVILHYKFTGTYFTYTNYFSKNIKFLFITPYHLPRRPVSLLLCIMLVLLSALSYSDLAKSWRGSVALLVLGLSVCMGHSMCVRLHVHVGHDKVIYVSVRATRSI